MRGATQDNNAPSDRLPVIRFSDQARRVVWFALHEVNRCGAPAVGTEHLALALAREEHGAAEIFTRLGVPAERVHSEIERQLGARHPSEAKDLPVGREAKRALDIAFEEASQLGDDQVRPEHLLLGLLGLLREEAGLGGRILRELTGSPERARDEIKRNEG